MKLFNLYRQKGENQQISAITEQIDLCFPDDDEKAKRDAGKWWKPWVSQPGGEPQHHTTCLVLPDRSTNG